MLEINLLPWREYVSKKKKKWFLNASIISITVLVIICFMLHGYLNRKLCAIEARITNISNHSDQWIDKNSDNAVMKIQNKMEKIRSNQDQLKALLHAMSVYSQISWENIEMQKSKIIMQGYVDQMSSLLYFVDYCDAIRYLRPIIKSIKMHSKFDSLEFQLQMNRFDAEIKKDELV